VLLAIEVLLFEFKPRSLTPVAAAVTTSYLLRGPLISTHALFLVVPHHVHLTALDEILCIPVGATGGLLAIVATYLIYRSEDVYERLPLHWMWWPGIGGLIIGIGGLIEPRALGVGYDVIDAFLTGRAGVSLIVGILVVKTLIWSLSLGSGTSGGVLAPTFMIGSALGALEGHVLPGVSPGFWALIGLAACVGGVIRAPLTGVVFPLELTHEWSMLVPCLVGSLSAYTLSVLLLKRSVLTERIARRGFHLSAELSTDPLELLLVAEAMGPPPEAPTGEPPGLVAFADQTSRSLARQMAETGASRAVVVNRGAPDTVIGLITAQDLLKAHLRDQEWERDRERTLDLRLRRRRAQPASASSTESTSDSTL
jgi:CIC family chloride channel protein